MITERDELETRVENDVIEQRNGKVKSAIGILDTSTFELYHVLCCHLEYADE